MYPPRVPAGCAAVRTPRRVAKEGGSGDRVVRVRAPTARPRRLVFGEVAELYDRVRPGYPGALFDELVGLTGVAPGDSVVEMGAGTGRATRELARRDLRVLALEPSPPMAALAARRCADLDDVRIVRSALEDWEVGSTAADLLVAAQAWHWIDPDEGFHRAARLLAEDGWIALFWNVPVARGGPVEEDLEEVYRRLEPDMVTHWGGSPGGEPGWGARLSAVGAFGPVTVREYPWWRTYTTAEYLRLLRTHSAHRMLAPRRREQLLQALGSVIERRGGRIRVTYACRLYAAPLAPSGGGAAPGRW